MPHAVGISRFHTENIHAGVEIGVMRRALGAVHDPVPIKILHHVSIAVFLGARRYELNRMHLKNQVRWEHQEAEKLEQVFYNLMSNAIKFTPANSGGNISMP